MSRLASSLLDGQPAVLHHNPSAGAEAKHFGHVLSLPLYPLLVLLSLFTSCREGSFSETGLPVFSFLRNSGTKRGPGYCHRFPSPYPFPKGVMWQTNMQMSVPGVTKCPRVQIFLVIGVTITYVTSCWMRAFSLFPICFQAANN